MEYNAITNRYKGKYDKNLEENRRLFTEKPPIPPKNMLLEITNSCNYKCIFCYWHPKSQVAKKGHMEEQLAYRLLKEAAELGVKEVGFSRGGEPLMNPRFDDYTRYAKQVGVHYVYITTNGYLLTLERAKSAIQAGLDSIKFSINALDEETYEKIEGVPKEYFGRVMQNLRDLYEFRKKMGGHFKIFVSYVMTRYNLASREEIKSVFGPYCDDVLIAGAQSIGGFSPEINQLLSVKEDVDFFEGREIPCVLPFNSISITKDGYLTGCCDDVQNYLAVADLNQVSLKEAWNCDQFQLLRRKHMNQDVKGLVCANCAAHIMDMPEALDTKLAAKLDKAIFSDQYVKERVKNWQED